MANSARARFDLRTLAPRSALAGLLLVGAVASVLGGCHRPEKLTADEPYVPLPSPAPVGPADPSVLEIRDGSDFAVTIPARAHACVVYPASLFDEATCPKALRAHSDPPAGMPAKARLLAIASLQPGGPSSVPLVLAVSLEKRDHPPYEPEPDTSVGFATGLSASLRRSHPEASLRGGAPEVRLLTAHGLPVVRMEYDLDGCTGTNEPTAHGSWYGLMTPQGFYTFTVNAPLEEAEIARELADEMAGTLRVSKLAPRLPASAGLNLSALPVTLQ